MKYIKPSFNQIDINFEKMTLNEIYNSKSLLPSFNDIINKEYNNEYEKNYKNIVLQTGLMLACYVGDLKSVKKLINEVGYVDLNDHNALYYAKYSLNPNSEILNLISEYEYFE